MHGFTHCTSSPKFPQANGEAERAVKTVKQFLEKNSDLYIAMLAYRSTPLENGHSPAELLMGRKLRTTLSVVEEQLKPSLPNEKAVRRKEKMMKQRMKRNYDWRHDPKELKGLQPGDIVWIPENKQEGTVMEKNNTRSYMVRVQDGTIRRNRRDLVALPDTSVEEESSQESELPPQPDQHNTRWY